MTSYLVALPPRRAHNWASKMDTPIGRHYLLRLETDDGLVGWGEAPAIGTWGGPSGQYYGETPETVAHIVHDYLFPALRDQDPRQIAACHGRLERAVKGHPYAKAAMDVALLDLAGKASGLPVYAFLGGKLRDSIPICHSLGIMENDAAVAEAEQAVAEGCRTIKCKTGLDPDRDVDLVRRLRERLGEGVGLRVDANEGYATVEEAIRVTRAMEPYGLLFHEQPVAGFESLARVARAVSVPIMADESAWFPADILRLYHLQAADVVSLYYTKPGGLWPAREVASLLHAVDMTCDIGGSIEMGVGVAANLHLGVSVPTLAYPSVCPVPNVDGYRNGQVYGTYYRDDILTEPLRFAEGHLFVPEGPGLGVEVDEGKLQRYVLAEA
jgi:muconate cycloisomerase